MHSESPTVVVDELGQFLNATLVANGLAQTGLALLPDFFDERPKNPENPDPMFHIGDGDPNDPATVFFAHLRVSESLELVKPNGAVWTRLSQQWLVNLFTAWEHNFRPRLAVAHGVDAGDEQYPYWGDVRHLRHDILHHHGRATGEHSGRCAFFENRFVPGEEIRLVGAHLNELATRFPRDEMVAGPT